MSILGLRKSESEAILRALASGVTPIVGLHHIAVGRRREVEQLLSELQVAADGGGGCKIVAGGYGSGKTFLLNLVGYLASRRGFVVCRGELQPSRAFCGAGRGLAMYQDLLEGMSTKAEPNGGALPRILERWLGRAQQEVLPGSAGEPLPGVRGTAQFAATIQERVRRLGSKLEGYQGGFDFASVLGSYFGGYIAGDEDRARSALRWLRGEVRTRAEAAQILGVRSVISDDNWYEYIRLWAAFLAEVGYAGLLLLLDESDNLYRISHQQTRARNYDFLLRMFNDAMQGRMQHLYFVLGGTLDFVEDRRRGLYSHEALKSRLSRNPLETAALRDMAQPVVELQPLVPEELAILLARVRDIHALHYSYEPALPESDIADYVEALQARPGAREFGTIREALREFVGALNLAQQNPGLGTADLLRRDPGRHGRSTADEGRGGDSFEGFQLR